MHFVLCLMLPWTNGTENLYTRVCGHMRIYTYVFILIIIILSYIEFIVPVRPLPTVKGFFGAFGRDNPIQAGTISVSCPSLLSRYVKFQSMRLYILCLPYKGCTLLAELRSQPSIRTIMAEMA